MAPSDGSLAEARLPALGLIADPTSSAWRGQVAVGVFAERQFSRGQLDTIFAVSADPPGQLKPLVSTSLPENYASIGQT